MRIEAAEGDLAILSNSSFWANRIEIVGPIDFFSCSFQGKMIASPEVRFLDCNFEGDCSEVPLGCVQGNTRMDDQKQYLRGRFRDTLGARRTG